MKQMTAEEAAEWGKTLDFKTVWTALLKLERTVDKMAKRVDRVTANFCGVNRSLDELIETLIAARLWKKFPQYGLSRAYQCVPIYNKKNEAKSEIDILLVDTDICMAVEVKNKLNKTDDVDHHLKRMELIRQYPPELVGNKQLLGAMAGGIVNPEIKDYAHAAGFFVLELSGENVRLSRPPKGFAPRQW